MFRRLADQIAERAREGRLPYRFEDAYNFEPVEFAHGDSTVLGTFSGAVQQQGGMLVIDGSAQFEFTDDFTDPVDLRDLYEFAREAPDRFIGFARDIVSMVGTDSGAIEPAFDADPDDVSRLSRLISEVGGTPYRITGGWSACFHAGVFRDANVSLYPGKGRNTP